MRHLRLNGSWIALIVMLANGCARETSSPRSEITENTENQATIPKTKLPVSIGLTFQIDVLGKTTAGTPIPAAITLKNESSDEVHVRYRDDNHQVKIAITNQAGNLVDFTELGQRAFLPRQEGFFSYRGYSLLPGEHRTLWDHRLDDYFVLPPGSYKLQAVASVQAVSEESREVIQIKSEEVPFEIETN